MKKVDNLLVWKVLLTIADLGSLKLAAEKLWIDPPLASRMLANLEDELGIFLLDRRSRPAVLTKEAKEILPSVSQLIQSHEALLSLTQNLRKDHDPKARRTLRISLPVNMDRTPILSALLDYESLHPGVHFEILADRGLKALLNRQTDLSFCFYSSDQPELHGTFVDDFYTFLLASRSFLKKHRSPETPEDLIHCLFCCATLTAPTTLTLLKTGKHNSNYAIVKRLITVMQRPVKKCSLRELALPLISTSAWCDLNFKTNRLLLSCQSGIAPWHEPMCTAALKTKTVLYTKRC